MGFGFNLLKKVSEKVIRRPLIVGNGIIQPFLKDKAYLLVCSRSVETKFKDRLFLSAKKTIVNTSIEIRELDDLISVLFNQIDINSIKWVVACGGGKINDAAKYLAKKLKRKLCIVPPILSTTNWLNGAIALRQMNILHFAGTKWPDAVLFDPSFLLENPKELHVSGIADILCCSSALYDWKLASIHSKDHFSNVGFQEFQKFIHKVICKPNIFKEMNEKSIITILEYFIEAMALCGACMSGRPLEGSEHFMYYYLDEQSNKSLIHGSVIAITSLLGLKLQGENAAIEPEKMEHFYKTIGINLQYVTINSAELPTIKEFVENRKYGYSILNQIT